MKRRKMSCLGKALHATSLCLSLSFLLPGRNTFAAIPPDAEFTLDGQFDTGRAINVVHRLPDQLQLDDIVGPLNFIWIAVSTKGTVVRVDTETGKVLGEYLTAPEGMGLNPSRTTVDLNGNVWVSNRDERGIVPVGAASPGIPAIEKEMGSVAHIGLKENGQCVDRNNNGVIDTSTGLGDVRRWSNSGNADAYGGVDTAEDECLLHYVRVNAIGTRHVSVNSENDVWVGGFSPSAEGRPFDLIDGASGRIVRQEVAPEPYGGYGGLIDAAGVIWSAGYLLRWDASLPLSGPNGGNWTGYSHISYGLCIDLHGNVWNTTNGNEIIKFAPDGTLLGIYNHGSTDSQGCVADANGDVWVAHSFWNDDSSSVGHLLNDGTFVGNVIVGLGPTGVAVDAAGKIWSTNYISQTASRIDPAAGPVGGGGVRVGQVDLTTVDLGGGLYNYSDMTGSMLTGASDHGTWTAVHDAKVDDVLWNTVHWTADEPGDSSITVVAANSVDCSTFGEEAAVTNGGSLFLPSGRCLRLTVSFQRSSRDEDGDGVNDSPILYDISVDAMPFNTPPLAAIVAISDGQIPVPVTMKVTPQTLNLARHGNWVQAHISDNSDIRQEMEVVLDGSGSSDADGDALAYDWSLTGPDGELAVDDLETARVVLQAGSYTAVLVVSDGKTRSAPATQHFVLTARTAADLPSGSYALNGIPQSGLAEKDGKIQLWFDAAAIAGTVDAGAEKEMLLTGAASGFDTIGVIPW